MSNSGEAHFDLEEGDAYDRIVVEGGYFDYRAAARDIDGVLLENARVLELCVGSGNLAVELAQLGHEVTGLDASQPMLKKARTRTEGLGVELVQGDATLFDLKKSFDAVVIHSGHLIINHVEDKKLRLNGESQAAMRNTVESVSNHLEAGGKLLLNVEHWNDKTVPYPDGSLYVRIIKEETDEYGSRVHIFHDKPSGAVISEVIIRRPKIPFDKFLGALAARGFGEFTPLAPEDAPDTVTLFSATKLR